MKHVVATSKAPAAIGPYSQALQAGNWLFSSGQIPLDPETGKIAGPDIETQTDRALKNLGAVLEAAGMSFDDVVKTTVFVSDMNNFATVNGIYGQFFSHDCPARSCVEVSRLPKDCLVEIEAIAYRDRP